MTSTSRNDEQIALLQEEIADLDRQLADGDITAKAASELGDKYRVEISALKSDSIQTPSGASDESGSRGRSISGRALVGSAIVGIAIVAIGIFAVSSLSDDSPAGVEGVASDVVDGVAPVDLSSITNDEMEAVVAENPDIVAMRLALARRYFEEGIFDKALDHYLIILEIERHPEALANVGWMTFRSGRPDVAVTYLEVAVEMEPTYLAAKWFLANVYIALERDEDAAPILAEVLSAEDVPEEIRDAARTFLAQIEASS